MTDATWAIQISPKLPDGTLVNVRADSPEQLDVLLTYVQNKGADIASAVQALTAGANVAGVFPGSQNVPAPQEQGWAQQGSQQSAPPAFAQPQQAAPQGGPGPAPSCVHGQMLYKSGIGKTGKPWQAWMCTAPKGQSCEPQWIR